MEKTTVVNLYREKYDVYIGRPGKDQDGNFGNPYSRENREDNIKLFKKYFYDRLKGDIKFARKVLKLQGKKLGCFCSPKPCHGQIIADYLNNLPETKPVKLAVVGSRSFTNYKQMEDILDWYDIKIIISGGAKGADALAEKYAANKNIPYQEFPAEWDKYGNTAGPIRNKKIVEACEEVVAFFDGISPGTANTIKIANEQGKPVSVYAPEISDDIENWG